MNSKLFLRFIITLLLTYSVFFYFFTQPKDLKLIHIMILGFFLIFNYFGSKLFLDRCNTTIQKEFPNINFEGKTNYFIYFLILICIVSLILITLLISIHQDEAKYLLQINILGILFIWLLFIFVSPIITIILNIGGTNFDKHLLIQFLKFSFFNLLVFCLILLINAVLFLAIFVFIFVYQLGHGL